MEQVYTLGASCVALGHAAPVRCGAWRGFIWCGPSTTRRENSPSSSSARPSSTTLPSSWAHRALGQSLVWRGEVAQARAHLERAIAIYDPQQHRAHAFRYGRDPGVDCRVYAAWGLCWLGYPEQGLEHIQAALPLAQALSHPFSLAGTGRAASISPPERTSLRTGRGVSPSPPSRVPYCLALDDPGGLGLACRASGGRDRSDAPGPDRLAGHQGRVLAAYFLTLLARHMRSVRRQRLAVVSGPGTVETTGRFEALHRL